MRTQAEKTFRAFRRQVLKVRKVMRQLPADAALTYSLQVKSGHVASASFDAPEEESKVRIAILMRPLLDPNSFIECTRVWELVKVTRNLDAVTVKNINEALQRVELGEMAFAVNQKQMTQRDIYETFAKGHFFHKTNEAVKMLKTLRFGPMTEVLWFVFYNYAHEMYAIASAVLAAFYIESDWNNPPEPIQKWCIYCLTKEGSFTSEEHVIPEAFGNDDAVLPRGYVCDICNNDCSSLDQYLVNFEAISLQRVINVPFTKDGKLPRAEFENLIVEKRMPRVIHWISKKDDDSFRVEDRPEDGTVRFNIRFQSRNPIDVPRLGRAIFKIALGMVAFQVGRERACLPRYDAARAFIAGRSVFDNALAMSTRSATHHKLGFTWLEADEGTPFGVDFYGVMFISNLEATPKLALDPTDPADSVEFVLFSLDGS